MAEQQPCRVPTLSVRADQALVGVPASEGGQEVTRFFAEEDAGQAASDQATQRALAALGSWSDLNWEETAAALDRIRHESVPTPPIEAL